STNSPTAESAAMARKQVVGDHFCPKMILRIRLRASMTSAGVWITIINMLYAFFHELQISIYRCEQVLLAQLIFGNEVFGTDFKTAQRRFSCNHRGEHDDRDMGSSTVALQALAELISIHLWHIDIQDDEGR